MSGKDLGKFISSVHVQGLKNIEEEMKKKKKKKKQIEHKNIKK